MQFSKVSGKKNDHKVTLYALSTCVWCKLTKQFLNENNVEYEFVDVDLLDNERKQRFINSSQAKAECSATQQR